MANFSIPPLPLILLLLVLLLIESQQFNAELTVQIKDSTNSYAPPIQTFLYSSPPPPPSFVTLPPPPPCEGNQGASVPTPPGVMPYYPSYTLGPPSDLQFTSGSRSDQRELLFVFPFLCLLVVLL